MKSLDLSVFDSFPVIDCGRFILREIIREDVDEIFKIRSNPAVNRYMSRYAMTEKDDAAKLIERVSEGFKNKQSIGWAASLPGQNKMIGSCGFNRIELQHLRAEIGGEMDAVFWGRNIGAEAVATIIKFGFEKLMLHSIEARVDPENRSAIALLDHLGFIREGYFREFVFKKGTYSDMAIYTLIEE